MNIKRIVLGALILASIIITSTSAATYTWTKTLKYGMNDPQVKTLQIFLNMYPAWQVATSGVGSPGYESTSFGTLTKSAVIRFQSSNGLTADGVFGPASQSVAYKIQDGTITTTTTCVGPTTQSCIVSNGTGTQSRMCTNGTWSTWSACVANSCNAGYSLVNGACVQNIVADTTFPSVYMVSPSNGTTVSSTISLSANATDNIAVAGVTFKVDGNIIGTEDTVSPYSASLNTTPLINGTHYVTATARDSSGNQTVSSTVSINVLNTVVSNPVPATLIFTGSSWKYLDNGTNQGTAWREVGFNDSTWASGNAELGYGDRDETTVLNYGTNASAKYATTYFRKPFTINDISNVTGLNLSLKRDDGAIVYLNGTELVRSNMPTGTVAYNTYSGMDASDDGKTWFTYTVPKTALVSGNNVVAVEIHQTLGTSSDISFDLGLSTTVSSTSATDTSQYYFNQDYTSITLTGTGSTRKFSNNYDIFGKTPYLSEVPYLWKYIPPYTDMYMKDNCDSGRRCLYLGTYNDDPNDTGATTRTQFELHFNAPTATQPNLKTYRFSHRMYLSPDLANLKDFDGALSGSNWIDIWESWLSSSGNSSWSPDPAGSGRTALYLTKDAPIGSPLYWKLVTERVEGPTGETYTDIAPRQTNKVVPITFGQWFTLDVTIVDGYGSNGLVKIIMTPDGGSPVTLFEIHDTTLYTTKDGTQHPEFYRHSVNPFKFYFGDPVLDWLSARGYTNYALYNDFKWYKN